ncbi:MAG: hypothetical protein WBW35_19205, partial [Xanthobacteraceae bacterium]
LDIAPERAQYIGAVAMRLGQIGRERNSAIETRQRFLALPKRAQRASKQNMRARVADRQRAICAQGPRPSAKRPLWQEIIAK